MKLRSMTFLSLLIIFSIAVAHVNADSKVENEVKTPISSKNLDEEYYDDLVTDLKKAGFTDVVVKKDEDLIFGFVHFDGEVEEIQIGKTTNFKKGASFSKNDKVTITYHTYSNSNQKESLRLMKMAMLKLMVLQKREHKYRLQMNRV